MQFEESCQTDGTERLEEGEEGEGNEGQIQKKGTQSF